MFCCFSFRTNIRDGLAPNATTSVGGGVIVNGRHHSNTSTALNSHAVLSDGRSTQLPNGVAPSPVRIVLYFLNVYFE